MPDVSDSLSVNPDYSIQFANTGTWEATTAYNNLLQTIILNTLGTEVFSTNNYFQIYPNPSSDFLTIQFKNSEKEEIQIYNSIGELVKKAIISNNHTIDVSELSSGIYFIHLINSNQLLTHKFIKQ